MLLAWDHDNSPSCADGTGLPVQPFTSPAALPHYPILRHGGVFATLACDGHVDMLEQEQLALPYFYTH